MFVQVHRRVYCGNKYAFCPLAYRITEQHGTKLTAQCPMRIYAYHRDQVLLQHHHSTMA